jgi:Uma2 family endonuclease
MNLTESWLPRHRLTVEEYHRMAEAGVLAADARVELIEGEVIDMAPIGSRHASVVNRLNDLLTLATRGRAIVQVQGPVRLGDRSEPEPDFALLRPRSDYYRDALPTSADVLLLIEVAESTQRYDRTVKAPLYARHGIPELWVIDLESALVHFYRRPSGDAFADISATDRPGATAIGALAGVTIDLSSVLR